MYTVPTISAIAELHETKNQLLSQKNLNITTMKYLFMQVLWV